MQRLQRLKSLNINRHLTVNTIRSKHFIIGVVIGAILIATPYLFYLYELAPDDSKVWETKWFTLTAGDYFYNVLNFVHASFVKLLGMLLTTLWFFTCKHWWRNAILVPFTLYLYQFGGVLNDKIDFLDSFNFWETSYLTLPITLSYFLIARKINRNVNRLDALDEYEAKQEQLLKKRNGIPE